jgi:phosphoribosyl 1,2-cyclic phosphate phosphodiesterase
MITTPSGGNICVDAPQEFRLQMLANNVSRVDAMLITHSHVDHVFGLDDTRVFNRLQGGAMPIYCEPDVETDLRRIYDYVFKETQAGGGKPAVDLRSLQPEEPVRVCGIAVMPLRVMHGTLPILSFKFGHRFAYVTDVSQIPAETWPHLMNLELLMLDAVRREPHATHFHLDAALDVIRQLKPKRTLLTHLSHDYDYDAVNAELPPGVELAYDGQVIDVSAEITIQ